MEGLLLGPLLRDWLRGPFYGPLDFGLNRWRELSKQKTIFMGFWIRLYFASFSLTQQIFEWLFNSLGEKMAFSMKFLIFPLLMLIKIVQTEEPEWTWPCIFDDKCYDGKTPCKELNKRKVCPPPTGCVTKYDDICFPCECLVDKGYCEPYPFREENAKCVTHFECGDGKLCNYRHKCQKIYGKYTFLEGSRKRCNIEILLNCEPFEHCFLNPSYNNKDTGICMMKTSNDDANKWLETEIKGHQAHHLFPNQNSPQLRLKLH